MKEQELELIRDYLDGRIRPDGLERLNQLLENDATARAEFRAMATLEEGLLDLSVASAIPLPGDKPYPAEPEPKQWDRFWSPVRLTGVAALLLACFVLSIYFLGWPDRHDEWGDAIAKIEFLDKEAAFEQGHQLPVLRNDLLGKGWIRLTRGRVRVHFRSGVTADLTGPAAMGLATPRRAYLEFGNVAVYTPESAGDFVLATESMEVVDLGTRFEINMDRQSGESKVFVIEGLVDLHLGSRGAERMIRPLEEGFEARVDASGKIVAISEAAEASNRESEAAKLLAHWTFDKIEPDGAISDSSGNGLDGKSRGALRLVPGLAGKALVFEDEAFVDLSGHISTLAELDAFSFTAWVRNPSDQLALLFSVSGESERQRVQLYLSRRFVRFGWQGGQQFDSISARVDGWDPKRWYHVAMTGSSGLVRLYRNGELIATGSSGSRIGTSVGNPSLVKGPEYAAIGRLADGRQGEAVHRQWYEGQMDEVQIYSGVLRPDDIRFLFQQPGKTVGER